MDRGGQQLPPCLFYFIYFLFIYTFSFTYMVPDLFLPRGQVALPGLLDELNFSHPVQGVSGLMSNQSISLAERARA